MIVKIKIKLYLKILIFLLPIFYIGVSQATENSWEIYNTGLTGGNIQAILVDPSDANIVYIGTLNGGFYWTDNIRSNNPSWQRIISKELNSWNFLSLMIKTKYINNREKRYIYAGTTSGVFYLDLENKGDGWQRYSHNQIRLSDYTILRLRDCNDPKFTNAFYIIGYENNDINRNRKLIMIKDNSDQVTVGLPNINDIVPYRQVNHLSFDIFGRIYVATDNGIFKFKDLVNSNEAESIIFPDTIVTCIAARKFKRDENNYDFAIFAGTEFGGRFTAVEPHWEYFPTNMNNYINQLQPWFSDKLISEEVDVINKIYAVTPNNEIFENNGLYKSWENVLANGLPPAISINTLSAHENQIDFAVLGSKDGVYYRENIRSWNSKNLGNLYAHRVHVIVHDTTNDLASQKKWDQLWAGTDGVLFYKDENQNRIWQRDSVYKFINDIEIHPDGEHIYLATNGEGIFRKKKNSIIAYPFNDGELWNCTIIDLAFDNQKTPNMYAGTDDGKIYQWSYEKNEWNKIEINLNNQQITSIAINYTDVVAENILYIASQNNVYQVNPKSIYMSTPPNWYSEQRIHSVVYNKPTDEIFAATSGGIKVHSSKDEIDKKWSEYARLSLLESNVHQIQIIPTDPRFKGILYAMTSDSVRRFSQIWRNIIDENFKESTIEYPDCQYGESFCVNLKNPNVVYLGTSGCGIYKYEFDQGTPPDILIDSEDFGDIAIGSEASGSIIIKNNNQFSPLIISFELEDETHFTIDSSQTFIVYPDMEKTFSFNFKPTIYNTIKSQLHVYWRDIFLPPVQQGSSVYEVYGTGKGADFIINNDADSIIYCYYKAYPESTIIDTFHWQKRGNTALTNFDVGGPYHSTFNTLENWANEFNSDKDTGDVHLSFTPTQLDTIKDSIQIRYVKNNIDTLTKTIKLEGIGLDAILTLDTNIIDFGEIPENDYSLEKTVFIKNTGNIPLIFNENPVIEPADNVFTCESALPETLIAGDYGNFIKLVFHPNKIDSFKSELIIFHQDNGLHKIDSTIVLLVGKGDTNMVAPFPIEALDFDTVHVKKLRKNSEKKSFYIKNISTKYRVWVDSIYITNNNGFRIQTNPAPAFLDSAKASCYDSVQVCLEFFADPAKDDTSLLGEHRALFNIKYRFGTDEANESYAIRTDTLKGFMISSLRIGNPTSWQPITPIKVEVNTIFSYQNSGNIPLFRQFIELPGSTFIHSYSLDKVDTILTDCKIIDTFKFYPIDTTTSRDSIKLHFWDLDVHGDNCVSDTVIISIVGRAIDNIPPIIEWVKYLPPVWHQPDTIIAKAYDEHSGLRENTPSLYFRRGGDFKFISKKMTDTGNGDSTYYAIINGDSITSRGVEFFIEAIDNSNTEGYYPPIESEFRYLSPPVTITAPGITKTKDYLDNGEIEFLHGGNAQQDYRLISIPLELATDNKSVANILGSSLFSDFHEHRWQCIDFQYDSVNNEVTELKINSYNTEEPFSEFIPGKSFLLLVSYRYPKCFIQKQTGANITTGEKFRFILHKGWNLIANPFNFIIPISNVSHGGELYSFDGKWIKVIDQEPKKQFLFPWEGNAIYVEKTDTLLISPNLNPNYGPTKILKAAKKPDYDWFITIDAFCQHASDVNNIAAVHKNSKLVRDKFDEVKPPSIGEHVRVSFSHPDWEWMCKDFAVDVQPPNSQGNFWDFTVCTNIENSEVKLSFKQFNSVPVDFQIFLISENLNVYQNLRNNNEFNYQSAKGHSVQQFRLLVGIANFVDDNDLDIRNLPQDYKLFSGYPNPFNMSTEIKYELPRQDQITISIYNVLGELVKKVDQKNQSPGKYTVLWDGTDQNNIPVTNGIYFFKLTTPNFSRTIKMTLIR